MYYPRELKRSWLRASREFPVLLLTGARQVGKTTFLRHVRERDRRYVTLDDPVIRNLATDDPALFLERYEPPVLIDEIQYAPQLLPLIKMAVDRARKPGLFWLTGSQQFSMMKGVSESLAGRVAIVNLLGFSNRERHRLDLDLPPFLPTRSCLAKREASGGRTALRRVYRDIWLGSFPALIAGAVRDRDLFYSSYLQTYLQRDVRDLSQVGDETAFLRFLRACAARTAQMLNLSELARDADVSVNTAKSWLSILRTSLQVHLLEPYHSSITKRLVKRPKLYFLDTGLCAYLTEWSSAQTLEAGAMSGAIFETHVLAELLKSWWHRGRQPQVYYYRDKDGKEIDFLFLVDRFFHPMEAKKSATPRRGWIGTFDRLGQFEQQIGEGGVLCMSRKLVPLTSAHMAIPVGLI